MLENVSIIFSICISISSLIIAVLSYRLKTPKLKIQILKKEFDCFFGDARCESSNNEHARIERISGVRLRIINNSPQEISIMGIELKCNNETYRLIDCKNVYWEIVEFIFPDENGEESSDGSAIYYSNEGISIPLKLGAYDGQDFVSLFYHFPLRIKKPVKAKIIIQTTVGIRAKTIKLIEYDSRFFNDDYRDYLQYLRSIGSE